MQTQEQNTTHSFTIFMDKWNITHTDSSATLGASPHWPSKLKSGNSSSSLLWWKTLTGLLQRICTIWMIPFEEYVFDISFSLFSLRQLKASWWLYLVKFSFTNILVIIKLTHFELWHYFTKLKLKETYFRNNFDVKITLMVLC